MPWNGPQAPRRVAATASNDDRSFDLPFEEDDDGIPIR